MIEKQSRNQSEQLIFIGSHVGEGPVAPEQLFDSVSCEGFVLVIKMGGEWSVQQGTKANVIGR
jgi:hypothetical protein